MPAPFLSFSVISSAESLSPAPDVSGYLSERLPLVAMDTSQPASFIACSFSASLAVSVGTTAPYDTQGHQNSPRQGGALTTHEQELNL